VGGYVGDVIGKCFSNVNSRHREWCFYRGRVVRFRFFLNKILLICSSGVTQVGGVRVAVRRDALDVKG